MQSFRRAECPAIQYYEYTLARYYSDTATDKTNVTCVRFHSDLKEITQPCRQVGPLLLHRVRLNRENNEIQERDRSDAKWGVSKRVQAQGLSDVSTIYQATRTRPLRGVLDDP